VGDVIFFDRLNEEDLCDKTAYDIVLSLHGLRGFEDERKVLYYLFADDFADKNACVARFVVLGI